MRSNRTTIVSRILAPKQMENLRYSSLLALKKRVVIGVNWKLGKLWNDSYLMLDEMLVSKKLRRLKPLKSMVTLSSDWIISRLSTIE